MLHRQWCCLHFIFCFLFGILAQTDTEFGTTPNTASTVTHGETVSSATTRSSGVTDGMDSTGTTEGPLPQDPTTALSVTPAVTTDVCVCDFTPNFCDIGCCCDTVDCGVDNLTSVFTGCPEKAKSGDCIEKWMMFHSNVDPSFVTVTDSLFCFHSGDDKVKVLAPDHLPALEDSYHFSPPKPTSVGHSQLFYRADDVIQTYFSDSSVQGLLRQPSPGVTSLCLNRNPARFLRSQSLSCTRMVTRQSCSKDPNLSALSYFSNLKLSKIPQPAKEQQLELLIPVLPLSAWNAPSEQKDTCVDVAKKVEFIITYTDRGELHNATVNVVLAPVKIDQLLQQVHSIQFKPVTPNKSPQQPIPLVGLRVGTGVIGRFNGAVEPVTIMGTSQGDVCSATQETILFAQNTITGCTFSSSATDCSEMRHQIYQILRGTAIPDVMAMNSGSEPDWTTVLKQECPINLEETCDSGCVLPYLLSVQVLWARMGLLHLPQSYILGAKYIFQCRKFKCPLMSPITLTTEVAFADMTVYPKPFQGFGST
uniref:tectonic-3-like n=1 Tax=Doryrhamphus excisus TaxID=161450 RepID=UPI0025AE71D6|nr:tectonic-3-like [Doryrhamphus excisus]